MSRPDARRADVVDTYHGVQVPDPYRWLEEPDSPETRAWVDAQVAHTGAWLAAIPEREKIRVRLERLWNHPRMGVPEERGGRLFFQHNDGLLAQPVLYVADRLDGERRVVLDPNTLSADGTVSLAGTSLSKDGRLLAYGLSDGGSDWTTWRVRDVETGEDLPDVIRWTKFSGITWLEDGSGFFYARYPEPREGAALEEANFHQKIAFHRLGTDPADDPLVFEEPDHPKRGFGTSLSEDGRTLVITVWESTDERTRVYLADLDGTEGRIGPVQRMLDAFDGAYHYLTDDGETFWFQTTREAPRGKVVAIDRRNPAPEAWRTVVPESEETLEGTHRVDDRLVLTTLHDAHSRVRAVALDGSPCWELALPGIGTAGGFSGDRHATRSWYFFTGFTTPTSIYEVDVRTGTSRLAHAASVGFDPDAYLTEQVFVTSRDGTRVPMFLVRRRDRSPDGALPTLLYGYGGFNIPLTPAFRVSTIAWLELGGVYAVANLRGGGEYGEAWHRAGTRERKQNVFDDFIACAEWLIDQGYTRPDRLAITGRSNGGLLAGATMLQRPDLFGAAIPGVGVLDMLRYHTWTIGWAWAPDYGTSDEAEMFPHLLAYSPVHNTRPGQSYPATLIVTADHDDRVVPAHSYKFAAALQHDQGGPAPILIRIDTRAGHGAGKPTAMQIAEVADEWAFLVRALDMEPPRP